LAESQWAKERPRRHEVNQRLINQHRRIHHEAKEGKLTRGHAAQLHRESKDFEN
jgi:hypothetical protein